ncbi:MAG: hypothetical protein ACUVX8_04330 [Candidatus Zipacnadales bacterium]
MRFTVSLLSLCSSSVAGPWDVDFATQRPSAALRLECRYVDAARTQAEVLAEQYRLILHLADEEKSQARLFTLAAPNHEETIGELWLEVTSGGEVFSSARAMENSRINLYRRGPYYLEVHWFDVQCVSESGGVFPAKGEVVFYCYADQLLVQGIGHAVAGSETMQPGVAQIRWLKRAPSAAPFRKLTAGDKLTVALPLFGPLTDLPPPEGAIEVLDGLEASYDAVRGCYVIWTDNPGGFNYHYYQNPHHYESARFVFHNDQTPRKVYVCHATRQHPGSVECGVLLDAEGHLLPIQVQINKNFAGEKEEPFYNPTDLPFSETFFPLYLAAGESRELTSLHLYQNWGNHPLKQFSSLGAWMDYYHSSTGVTETTCFVPFKFGGLPGVNIADLRPMSQRMWDSQPQHDNVAGHRFLMIRAEDQWHFSKYEGTTFRSTGPNWMDISLDYTLDDGRLHARLDSFELPQTDELRNFLHLHVEVLKPLKIANLSTDFRLLDITSRIQALRYTHAAYQSAPDTVQTVELHAQEGFAIAGEPLGGTFPWATVYGDRRGCNSYVIRHFQAKLGGEKRGPAVCVQTHASGDMELALTAVGGPVDLLPGDFVEADLYLRPYGDGTHTYETPQRDRISFGENAPHITKVTEGRKLSDFPTRLCATPQGRAQFSLIGGANLIPVIIEGLPDYRRPRLETQTADGGWQPVSHETVGNDGYQVFVDDAGTFGCVFLVNADGREHTYRVSVAQPTNIKVEPKFRPADAPLANLVYIQAPWMNQPINLRFPETIITAFGIHFIDHVRPDMPGRTDISILEDYHRGPDGSYWYDWTLSDNCRAGGIINPGVDEVTFEYSFYNGNDRPTWIDTQFCLRLWDDLLRDATGERTYIVSDGRWVRMADTDRGKGRQELCHYPTIGGLSLPDNEDPAGWGKSRITADRGLVAVVAPDGRHVIGLAFDHPKSILSNWLIPCVHSDPIWPECPPKGRVRVKGKLYLMEGTLDDLLARWEADH